jgi:hypothetical protein
MSSEATVVNTLLLLLVINQLHYEEPCYAFDIQCVEHSQ